jgi:tRNA modification GTPase
MVPPHDTIFALSSGRPPSAIAVVRLSGPQTSDALRALGIVQLQPRRATLADLQGEGGETIDEAVVLWFPQPASATGEDVAELHVHGSRAVLTKLFATLSEVPGLRPAEPGEFTRRGFENGKLDLTEAEGLADLIEADTEMQRRQALRQLKGLLGARTERWREQIIAVSALIEAGIDFSDEGDVPDELMAPALAEIAALRREIEDVLASSAHGERLRDGLIVTIAGPPNVGKSTLLNRLAKRDAAIVSPHAGTTRDVIEVRLDLKGYPLVLIDTAGIRETEDSVEQEGVARARARAADADLVLWLSDSTAAGQGDAHGLAGMVWNVWTKIDLAGSYRPIAERQGFTISGTTGEGLEALTSALADFAEAHFGGEAAVVTRHRHRELLRDAAAALGRAEISAAKGEEIVAEELRIAVHSLGRLTGRVDVEDVLGKIFAEFCIGK